MCRAFLNLGTILFFGLAILPRDAWAQRSGPARVPEGTRVLADVEYIANGHERNKLDLYLPEKSDKPLPLIVYVHGGAWMMGSKQSVQEQLPLLSQGFAVAAINYRLSQHARFPSQIEDCKAAIRWLRANAEKYNLDKDRIGVIGGSAGGHLVALLGTSGAVKEFEVGEHLDQSSAVQAVCDWFGPTDFLQMGGSHNDAGSPESKLVGGAIQSNKEAVAKANPITYITKSAPPFLIMHGDQDRTVPVNQSELLNEALKVAGTDVVYVPIKGAGHGGPQFHNAENRKLVQDFFNTKLKNEPPAGAAAQAAAPNENPRGPANPDGPNPAAQKANGPPMRPGMAPGGGPMRPNGAPGAPGMRPGMQPVGQPGAPGMRPGPGGPGGQGGPMRPGQMRPGAGGEAGAPVGLLIPDTSATLLELTPEQIQKIEQVQKEADLKLSKILTPEQAKKYTELRAGANRGP